MNRRRKTLLYLTSSLLAAGVFIALYGIRVLNPAYTDWLMKGGDLTQHYLGWKAFRIGAWQFPIGLTNMLSYPDRSSIIFTDSIPLLSVFFKALSPLLPQSFQFFGIYGLVCFMLSGVLSSAILCRYTDSWFTALVCSLFFVLAPIMIFRMFLHTALASHWIILLGLQSIFLYEERYADHPVRTAVLFGFLGLLSGSIHIYYTVFTGFILIGYWIMDITHTHRIKTSVLTGLSFAGIFLVTVYLMGGISSHINPTSGGLGLYSMNLNSFFNPMGWSDILQGFPVLNAVQEEECLGYPGLGMLVLVIPALIIRLGKGKQINKGNRIKYVSLAVVFLLSFVFALSPAITFNDRVLFEYKLPWIISKAWSVFRATGRFCWLPLYILMFAVLINVLKQKSAAPILLTAALALQCYDLSGMLRRIHAEYAKPFTYESPLKEESFWTEVGNKPDVKHLIFTDSTRGESLYAFVDYALDHGMTVNDYYFARSDVEAMKENLKASLAEPDDENLYIFTQENLTETKKYQLIYYKADGWCIGVKNPLPGLESYRMN